MTAFLYQVPLKLSLSFWIKLLLHIYLTIPIFGSHNMDDDWRSIPHLWIRERSQSSGDSSHYKISWYVDKIYSRLQINIYVVPVVYLYDAVVSANAYSLQTGMSSWLRVCKASVLS